MVAIFRERKEELIKRLELFVCFDFLNIMTQDGVQAIWNVTHFII